jgi:hypothetical protein
MDWLMDNWLDLTRFWAAVIGTGCFGLVGVLVADRFSSHGRIEDADDGALAAELAH